METLSILVMILTAAGNNLLMNPGFESVRDNAPARWDLFVMPREGCRGEIDEETTHEGLYSVKLHNETPYDKEPANNWSQGITANLRNRELRVSGWIKTQGATEAAFWFQAFQRSPLRILAFESTASDRPVCGDTDWTEVEMRVTVPNETDFVMLRCVLLGEGTAWFDGLAVEDARQSEPEKPDQTPAGAVKDETSPQPRTDPTGAAPSQSSVSLEELRTSRQALADANRTLRELNTSLLAQISALQAEIERLRQEIQTIRLQEPVRGAEPPFATSIPWPEMPVPPLVPHAEPSKEELP